MSSNNPPPAIPPSGFASSPPPSAQHQQQPMTAPPANSKVSELKAMFPTVEVSVIEIILESVGGSQDRAIEQLLAITDEDFRPEADAPGTRREGDSQLELDAEFARSLQFQDEQEQCALSQRGGGVDQAGHTNPMAGGLPYQPRVRRAGGGAAGVGAEGGQGAPGAQGIDHERYQYPADGPPQGAGQGMLQVEEKLERFAEAGKQTISNLFSMAKTKYAEFQANQAAGNQPGQAGANTKGGLWGTPQGQHQREYGQQGWAGEQSAAGWGRGGAVVGGGRGGVQNYQYASGGQGGQGGQSGGHGGWDDGRSFTSRSESFSSESTFDRDPPTEPVPVARASTRWNPSDAYDDPLPPGRSTPTNAASRIDITTTGRRSPGVVGSPDKGLTAARPIDATKLGILPKKKVDLLSSSPSASSGTAPLVPTSGTAGSAGANGAAGESEAATGAGAKKQSVISKIPATPPAGSYKVDGDSDDELEYTKNPFDEK